MKSRFRYLVSLFLGFVFSYTALAGEVDVHFGPVGQEATHTISGDIESSEERLNLVPDDAAKSNSVFQKMVEKAQSNYSSSVEATLVSHLDQSSVAIKLVLFEAKGRSFFIAELGDGTKFVWEHLSI